MELQRVYEYEYLLAWQASEINKNSSIYSFLSCIIVKV